MANPGVDRRRREIRAAFYGLITAVLLSATFATAAAAQSAQGEPAYLALGDSLGVGVGASDRTTNGYVHLFFQHLQEDARWAGRGLTLNNLAISGETSNSMMTSGGQLDQAIAELEARNGDADPSNDVEIITIHIGGDDLLEHLRPGQPCFFDVQSPECEAIADAVFATFSENLAVILGSLRSAAGPDAIIIALTYYNPYSGTGTSLDEGGDERLAQFNEIINTIAASPGISAQLADVFPIFRDKGPQLTHILEFDIHPNDEGYAAIAQALIAALPPATQPTASPTPSPSPTATTTPGGLPPTGGSSAGGTGSADWLLAGLIGLGLAALGSGAWAVTRMRRRRAGLETGGEVLSGNVSL